MTTKRRPTLLFESWQVRAALAKRLSVAEWGWLYDLDVEVK